MNATDTKVAAFVRHNPSCTVSDVMRGMGTDAGTALKLLLDAERAGLIVRTWREDDDRGWHFMPVERTD